MNLAPDCLRINGKRVIVELDPPPIPFRGFDYRDVEWTDRPAWWPERSKT